MDASASTEDGEQDNQGTVEGTPILRLHRTYERDPRNRAKAIVYHGNRCFGCGFSFDDVYTSEHANGYVEIHLIQPLAAGPRLVDPYLDLIPLCANCHRMVHRRAHDWLSLDQLRQLLAEAKANPDETIT
jgi:5-methylcytosine-specific restriction protein A